MQNKINFTAFKFIITMQWHRNQIERGGLDLSKILASKIKRSLVMVMYNFAQN